jgi:putative nucleotidyltransferase with HDIG domain
MLHLRVVRGPGEEDWMSVSEGGFPFTVGRDQGNRLQIRSSAVSRFHAVLTGQGSDHYVEDLGSTNGTLLNGKRVKRAKIAPGDKITIANVEILVEAGAAPFREKRSALALPVSVDSPTARPPAIALSHSAEELATDDIVATPRGSDRSKSNRVLEILYKADRITRDIDDFKQMLENFMDLILAVLPASRGYILLVEGEASNLVPYVRRAPGSIRGDTELVVSKTILNRTVERSESVLSADALLDERFGHAQSICDLNVRSAMCAPLVNRGKVLGVIYVDSTARSNLYTKDDLALLSAMALKAGTSLDNARLYDGLRDLFYNTVETLIRAIQARDRYTSGHSARVSRYSLLVAEKFGFGNKEKHELYLAAILHDIGKIGIPDELLNREGKLTADQMRQIRSHVTLGASMLKALGEMNPVVPLILHHHEAWDGSGYPDGLKGEEIPLMSRILAVADAYDAMTSDRPYRKALTVMDTVDEIRRYSGRTFDPKVVDAFLEVLEEQQIVPAEAAPVT